MPWAGRLWVVTYAPHAPRGSDDKLYEIDEDLRMTVRKESVGGTPANRMIHGASGQLLIGPYFIDRERRVRVIPPERMPGRLTATAAHLTDPEDSVYFMTMEEGLYAVNVHDLGVRVIYPDGNTNRQGGIDQPWLPGTHGKGAYTSQGLLVYANNGERKASMPDYAGPAGCLAAWDGKSWKVIERKQFTEVTGPGGIYGNPDPEDPVWSLGWDTRSVILKLLDHGQWYTYRLPKASFTYGGKHGWFTEWPRIREADHDRRLMTMSGMFWEFPGSFSAGHTAGIRPLSGYLKMVVDLAYWHDRIVFGCNDASLFDNRFLTQTQSNLWFVKPEELEHFGPAAGFGGVWMDDTVKAGIPSDPWLTHGFDHVMIHLANGSDHPVLFTLEADQEGSHHWETFKQIKVPEHGYRYFIFPEDLKVQWIRVSPDRDASHVTAYLFNTQNDARDLPEDPAIFNSLPKVNDNKGFTFGLIRPGGKSRGNLQFAAQKTGKHGEISEIGYYEVDENMKIREITDDDTSFAWMQEHIPVTADFTFDRASVILKDRKGRRFRLPVGDTSYMNEKVLTTRGFREVVTERSLLNCMGTFYEVPHSSAGGYAGMKPVCTHNRIIYDYCSWRGMMVISGNLTGAGENGHYFRSDDGKAGLWFGTVDDLWKLGKPYGRGGPWLDTQVKAGEPSDPYLMTGYDEKILSLSADRNVTVTAEVCFDLALKHWYPFRKFTLEAGEKLTYHFPEGYEAHWIRFRSDSDCRATAQLVYQ